MVRAQSEEWEDYGECISGAMTRARMFALASVAFLCSAAAATSPPVTVESLFGNSPGDEAGI